eukprot:664502-Pelagomonas_calceolata.AAC.3
MSPGFSGESPVILSIRSFLCYACNSASKILTAFKTHQTKRCKKKGCMMEDVTAPSAVSDSLPRFCFMLGHSTPTFHPTPLLETKKYGPNLHSILPSHTAHTQHGQWTWDLHAGVRPVYIQWYSVDTKEELCAFDGDLLVRHITLEG